MSAAASMCHSCGSELPPRAKFCNECGAAVAAASRPAEYKQVTVLFADVVHSMDIAARVGPERLREIMTVLLDRSTAVVKRYGGTVDKFTGDGIMALFGAPAALEDHALRGCLAALAIQDEANRLAVDVDCRDGVTLQLRVGLNSGEVIAGEIGPGAKGYTALGEQVGTAQRMESVAPPGGVMLSASTVRLVDGAAILGEPEMVRIKGVDQPAAAYRLLGMREQHRAVGAAESRLVGRQWEMSAIEGLLDRAISGHGGVVGVVGPPGIGKSRLVRELAAMAARRGVEVFTTFCESHTSQVPFRVVTRLLRAATRIDGLDPPAARALIDAQGFDADSEDVLLFEDLLGIGDPDVALPRIDPDARRRRLTALVNAAALANRNPAVYVVEDAHWIDEVSESMLADFLTVVPQTQILTLITYRSEYRGALAQVPGAQTISLTPLREPETAALVSELLGSDPSVEEVAEAVTERSAGTPFFVEEIVRELAERGVLQGNPGAYVSTAVVADFSVPATLQSTIAARIDRLDPKAKRTLSAASVVGSRFGVDVLTALGVEPIVTDLLAAQLIDQVTFTREPEFVFHHPLIRTVAYETQLKADRADLHRRVAAAIEQSASSVDEHAALIAQHLESAGDSHAAFSWHMRAGTWLNNRDVSAARVSWERARQVADSLPDDDPDRPAMRIAPRTMLCAAGWRVRSVHDSDDRFEELRELCALAGDKTSLALGILGPMSAKMQRGEMREASQLASEQMALLESIDDPSLAVIAAFGVMGVKSSVGELADVLRWAQITIEWADGDPTKGALMVGSPLAMALVLRGVGRWWFGRPGWRADLDDAYLIAETSEPLTLAVVSSWKFGLGIMEGVLAANDTAIDTLETALRTVEASGNDYAVEMVRFVLGTVLLQRTTEPDRHRGLELITPICEMWTQGQYMLSELPVLNAYVGREAARGGDRNGVTLIRQATDAVFARGQLPYCGPLTNFLVEALLASGADGDAAEAQDAIARLEATPAEGSVIREIWLLRLRALLAQAHGDEAAYRDDRDRYRDMAQSLGFQGHIAWAEAMA
jgi:class 3 adenylate cyclase